MPQLGHCMPGSTYHWAMAASCRLLAEVRPTDSILSSGGKYDVCTAQSPGHAVLSLSLL